MLGKNEFLCQKHQHVDNNVNDPQHVSSLIGVIDK